MIDSSLPTRLFARCPGWLKAAAMLPALGILTAVPAAEAAPTAKLTVVPQAFAGQSVHGTLLQSGGIGALHFTIASQPAQGQVTLDNPAYGSFTYTAPAKVTPVPGGRMTFSFRVSDETGSSAVQQAYLTVLPRAAKIVPSQENPDDDAAGTADTLSWTGVVKVATCLSRTFGLKADGTVRTAGWDGWAGFPLEVDTWTNIADIATNNYGAIGVTTYGTVVTGGTIGFPWEEGESYVAAAAGEFHFLALRNDGTVGAHGDEINGTGALAVDGWTDVVSIASADVYSFGVRADGTVLSTGIDMYGTPAPDVSGWTNVVKVVPTQYGHFVFGLRADGTVLAAGASTEGEPPPDFSTWSNIVDIGADSDQAIGIKADGKVISKSFNHWWGPFTSFKGWTNVVAVVGDDTHVVFIKGNTPPTGGAMARYATQNQPSTFTVGNDIDRETLRVSGLTDGAHGTVVANGDGTVTYTPEPGYLGSDSFPYEVTDGDGRSATGTVTVTVYPALTATDLNGGVLTSAEVKNSLTFTPGGGSGTYTVTSTMDGYEYGRVVDNGDGSFTFHPGRGAFAGTYVVVVTDQTSGFTYEITVTVPLKVTVDRPDLLGKGGTATVTVRGAYGVNLDLGLIDAAGANAADRLATIPATAWPSDKNESDYQDGFPATVTLTALDVADDAQLRVTASCVDCTFPAGQSGLVTVIAAETFSGMVTDQDGNIVRGAAVVAEGQRDGLNAAYVVHADVEGAFRFNAPKATASLVVAAPNHTAVAVAPPNCAGPTYSCVVPLGPAGTDTLVGVSDVASVGDLAVPMALGLAAKPVVLAGVPSESDSAPGVARVGNVTKAGFNLRFAEWEGLDGSHPRESIGWMALQPGRYNLPDGSVWEIGTFPLGKTGVFKSVNFTQPFLGAPRLFVTVQSANESDLVTVRAKAVTNTGFKAALYEEEARMDGHVAESVGYLAIYNPMETGTVLLGAGPVDYSLAGARLSDSYAPVLSDFFEARLQEETSGDAESDHKAELVDLMMLGSGLFGTDVTSRDSDTVGLRFR